MTKSTDDRFEVLEIKCPFTDQPVDRLIAESSTDFCLREINGEIQLKRQHPYFTQVQHHMAVVRRHWCDFVVFTRNSSSESISVVRAPEDSPFWCQHFVNLDIFSTTSLYQRLSLLLLQFSLFPNFHLLSSLISLPDHPYPLLSENSFKNDCCSCPTKKNWLSHFQLEST